MRRVVVWLFSAALLAVAVAVLALPRRPAIVEAPAWTPGVVVAGAFHVHTNRSSDSSGSIDEAAAAARRAGMQFVISTEHGDGTRPPLTPEYRDGVLWIEGVEVSTADGHYATVGMSQTPYPLGGDARDVVEDVRRFGGMGVAAHGDSLKSEGQWRDWQAEVDGLEWLNLDSAWRDAEPARLARAVLTFWLRPPETLASLMSRPDGLLSRLDTIGQTRRVFTLAATDAHGGFPSYEACFPTFSTRVELTGPLTGIAADDARVIVEALKAGHHFTAIDAFAAPPRFEFGALAEGRAFRQGDLIGDPGPITFRLRMAAPPGASAVLLRNGAPIKESSAESWQMDVDGRRGSYRVEVRVPGAPGTPPIPWIVSNPIAVGLADVRDAPVAPAAESNPVAAHFAWRAEKDSLSTASVSDASDTRVTFRYTLGGGPATNQFAAAAAGPPPELAAARGIALTAHASHPLRFTVQLRQAADRRWQRSIYVDPTDRTASVRFEEMRPIPPNRQPHPTLSSVEAILLLIDTTNTSPGTSGEIDFKDLVLER